VKVPPRSIQNCMGVRDQGSGIRDQGSGISESRRAGAKHSHYRKQPVGTRLPEDQAILVISARKSPMAPVAFADT
jgi:hypothetical protein